MHYGLHYFATQVRDLGIAESDTDIGTYAGYIGKKEIIKMANPLDH